MPTLIILRGTTPDREIELDSRTLKLGRGDQNDVVLPDPGKAVSRFHAELRTEHGRYVVVDLNSQNGVWLGGRRVPQATLEPGVPVVIGTYQLVLKPERQPLTDSAEATVLSPRASGPLPSGTMVAPLPVPDRAPEPLVPGSIEVAAAPLPPLPISPPKPTVPAKPAPAAHAKATAPPKTAATSKGGPQARPARPAPSGGSGAWKWVVVGGGALLLLAVVVGAVLWMPVGGSPASSSGSPPADAGAAPPPAAAPATAPPTAVTPVDVPAAPPTETRPPVATAPVAPAPTTAPAPPSAPPRAVQPPAPPRVEPAPARRPAATPPRAEPSVRRGAAAPAADTKPKGPNLALAFEEARAAINRGDYPAAISGLESILAVDPNYPKAAETLDVARNSARNAARTALEAGGKAETDRDYPEAERQYQRALNADPNSAPAQDGVRRVKARMVSEGEDAFKRARQYDALGRVQDAISMYEKAIQLLPSEHASVKIAMERLAALKGGVQR